MMLNKCIFIMFLALFVNKAISMDSVCQKGTSSTTVVSLNGFEKFANDWKIEKGNIVTISDLFKFHAKVKNFAQNIQQALILQNKYFNDALLELAIKEKSKDGEQPLLDRLSGVLTVIDKREVFGEHFIVVKPFIDFKTAYNLIKNTLDNQSLIKGFLTELSEQNLNGLNQTAVENSAKQKIELVDNIGNFLKKWFVSYKPDVVQGLFKECQAINLADQISLAKDAYNELDEKINYDGLIESYKSYKVKKQQYESEKQPDKQQSNKKKNSKKEKKGQVKKIEPKDPLQNCEDQELKVWCESKMQDKESFVDYIKYVCESKSEFSASESSANLTYDFNDFHKVSEVTQKIDELCQDAKNAIRANANDLIKDLTNRDQKKEKEKEKKVLKKEEKVLEGKQSQNQKKVDPYLEYFPSDWETKMPELADSFDKSRTLDYDYPKNLHRRNYPVDWKCLKELTVRDTKPNIFIDNLNKMKIVVTPVKFNKDEIQDLEDKYINKSYWHSEKGKKCSIGNDPDFKKRIARDFIDALKSPGYYSEHCFEFLINAENTLKNDYENGKGVRKDVYCKEGPDWVMRTHRFSFEVDTWFSAWLQENIDKRVDCVLVSELVDRQGRQTGAIFTKCLVYDELTKKIYPCYLEWYVQYNSNGFVQIVHRNLIPTVDETDSFWQTAKEMFDSKLTVEQCRKRIAELKIKSKQKLSPSSIHSLKLFRKLALKIACFIEGKEAHPAKGYKSLELLSDFLKVWLISLKVGKPEKIFEVGEVGIEGLIAIGYVHYFNRLLKQAEKNGGIEWIRQSLDLKEDSPQKKEFIDWRNELKSLATEVADFISDIQKDFMIAIEPSEEWMPKY